MVNHIKTLNLLTQYIRNMAFGNVLMGILGVYAVYYAGNIFYDLTRKSPEENVKDGGGEEVDIDEIAKEVIQTQEVGKSTMEDYMPPSDSSETEGYISSVGLMTPQFMAQLVEKAEQNKSGNPFNNQNIANIMANI